MGVRTEDPAEVRSGLQKALEYSGPTLIDVVTDPNALSMPFSAASFPVTLLLNLQSRQRVGNVLVRHDAYRSKIERGFQPERTVLVCLRLNTTAY